MRPAARLSVISIVVIALAVAGGWWAAGLRPDGRPALTSALDVLPARTNIVGFTDWSRLGDRTDLNGLGRRDLTTRSALAGAAEQLDDVLGWSPADLEWEVYGQDPTGAEVVVRLGGSVSFGMIRDELRAAGYRRKGDTWSVSRSIGLPDITTYVALVPRQRLIVMSGNDERVPGILDVVHGRARSLAADHAAAATAQALSGSDSVLLQGGTLGCESTAITASTQQRQARAALERAGRLESFRFSGRGLVDRGGAGFSAQQVVFAMTFESGAVATDQARVRAELATGPFVGRAGPVEDTLRLRSARADDATVRLAFAHDPDTDVFMTGSGPILFATCPSGVR